MKKDIEQVSQLIHSLCNRMTVIDHLIKFYAKNLPEHRLTEIGVNSLEDAKEEMKQIRNILENLSDSEKSKETEDSDSLVSLEKWKQKLVESKDQLSEMSIFSIDIAARELPEKSVYVEFEDIQQEIGLYFEEIAMTGATKMDIQMLANDKVLKLSFSDNGDGSLDSKSDNLIKLKNTLQSKDIQTQVRAIPEVGSSLTLNIKIAS